MGRQPVVWRWLCAAVAAFAVLAVAGEVHAHSVTVDPGSYAGQWRTTGSYLTGTQTIDLATGSHSIRVGSHGSFGVTVDASGGVVVDNGISGVGGLGTLTFNTQSINIDPGDFDGQWRISRGDPATYVTGAGTANFVPGVAFGVGVGSYGVFVAQVDAAGNVSVQNGVSAVGGLNSLTFNTVDASVDPGDFDGSWVISRGEPSSYVTGVNTATFVPGVTFGMSAGTYGSFFVEADLAGNITVNNGVSGVGGLNSLTFNTVDVVVDPADFDGSWVVSRGEPAIYVTGVNTATVVPGVRFGFSAGSYGLFFITADLAGNVTVENGISGVGGAGTLTFNTVDVAIDPGNFAGSWIVSRGEPGTYQTGPGIATFVPGARFAVGVGTYGQMFVSADGAGNMVVENGVSAVGGPYSLTFNTSAVTFDPGTSTWAYLVSRAHDGNLVGKQTLELVPGLRYLLDPAGPGAEFFDVLEPCEVSPSSFTFDNVSITAECGCTDGDLDGICDLDDACPNDPDNDADGDGVCGDVDLCSGNDASGDGDGDGICDDNDFCAGDNATGDIDNDGVCNDNDQCSGNDTSGDSDGDGICNSDDQCAGDDTSGNTDGDGFCDDVDLCAGDDLTGDTDADGLCDDSDLCPLDADNDDDGDGVCGNLDVCIGDDNTGDSDADNICDDQDLCEGNDASGDQDADGFCDDVDNCPIDANPTQSDSDGDAVGDVCEADTDADGINDDVDNCVDVINVDQADLDADGIGDVCDDDDDADGILDGVDNCPTYANTDQADFDQDGFGDVCDGDDDADGVSDDVDLCPGTPLSSLFDDDGCSGPQLIELTCGAPQDHSNRGRYVSCVAKASKVAQRRGLITRRERAVILRHAARRTWYRPRNRRCWWR